MLSTGHSYSFESSIENAEFETVISNITEYNITIIVDQIAYEKINNKSS